MSVSIFELLLLCIGLYNLFVSAAIIGIIICGGFRAVNPCAARFLLLKQWVFAVFDTFRQRSLADLGVFRQIVVEAGGKHTCHFPISVV
ncbi:MAG: hypothetical protein ACLT74_05030 [Christensenellales bacterium]